jgi:putative heme-binding domain-containing protein
MWVAASLGSTSNISPSATGESIIAQSKLRLVSARLFRHKKRMQHVFRLAVMSLYAVSVLFAANGIADTKALSEAERLQIALEAISRIEVDINTNATLRAAVYNLLPKLRGTPDFVRIVKKFQLKDQPEGLLEVAGKHPADDTGVEAMRLLLDGENTALLNRALANTNGVDAAKVAEALGNTKDKRAVPLLLPVVDAAERDIVLRKMAVRGLAQTEAGAGELLKLAQEDRISIDLKLTASSELNGARWAKIKSQAAKLLPLPTGRNAEPLPPMSELVKIAGDPSNGEKIYFREEVMCGKCHAVKGRGGDVGPALSEIGSKLGKDALLEAILQPSAGISHGYEASSIETKSGDEAYGIIVSETAEEVAIKDLNGIVTRHNKGEIAQRKLLKTSLMPDGLAATMTTQELADLVEYLSTLKKL